MKKLFILLSLVLTSLISLTSCSENYSNGERIGVITQFSESGMVFKSHEGHLNVTQTGMNSSVPFDFSIDNDREDPLVIATLDSAAQHGWKVKLIYHETFGKNWFHNRGETSHFVTKVEVLEKNFGNNFNGGGNSNNNNNIIHGRVIDTIYVVIDRTK
jgi:hypothetical protein